MRILSTLAVLALTLAATATPGWAGGMFLRATPPGTFAVPVDPWRNWPPRQFEPRRHHHHPSTVIVVVPGATAFLPPPALWIPEQWVWNGFGWIWVPGHWSR